MGIKKRGFLSSGVFYFNNLSRHPSLYYTDRPLLDDKVILSFLLSFLVSVSFFLAFLKKSVLLVHNTFNIESHCLNEKKVGFFSTQNIQHRVALSE